MKFKLTFLILLLISVETAFAGGCLPGDPCYDPPKPKVVPPPVVPEPVAATESCGWSGSVAAGVPVWFFQEEDTEVGGGIYADLSPCDSPLNFRIGAEVGHMDLEQEAALSSAEFPGKLVQLTFVRIPFAVEYSVPVAENTTLFVGGGPDIITTANDISDTTVGLHLSARLAHALTESFGVALEAGYMWGEIDADGGDVDLDNTFVIPSLFYQF